MLQFANLTALVVDENRFMRGLVKQLLNSVGIKSVLEVIDTAEALGELKRLPIDVVICELTLEPIDGVEFIRMIRTAKDSANPMVPVIVLSGETRLTKVMAARDAGMTEFLAKPISAKTFYARLLSALEKPRPFVKALTYFGPDRRRREISQGRDRRRSQPVILTQKR